ncbi:hypothetical protein L1D53_17160 [Vibrio alginolyticus]|nr:hypothetical protein [Vibrio alginolyticus]
MTKYQTKIATANMTPLINNVELTILQGTPVVYLMVRYHKTHAQRSRNYLCESVDCQKSINGLWLKNLEKDKYKWSIKGINKVFNLTQL